MSAVLLPSAVRHLEPNNGTFTGGPPKGLLHSTEAQFGNWATYKPGTKPHLEIIGHPATKTIAIRQFYPFDQPARSLVDGPLAIRTNRDGVIQIELGFQAAHVDKVPDWFWTLLAAELRKIEDMCGINPDHWATFKGYPASYGANNGVRFTPHQWDTFDGWCGHMHVPDGNAHGDPGAIPVAKLRKPPPAPAAKPPVLWMRMSKARARRNVDWIKKAQRRLGIPATGIFDRSMRRHVLAFRRKHDLKPHRPAVIGRRCWELLLKEKP